MSVRTMASVWEHSRHSGTELLMLLAIADFSDDDGRAYPSIATLARKCRMSPRNVNHLLPRLTASGELSVKVGGGPCGTNVYRVTLSGYMGVKQPSPLKSSSPLKPASSEEVFTTPEELFLNPLKPASPKPSMNHKNKESGDRKAKPVPVWISAEQLVADGLKTETAEEFLAYRQTLKRILTARAWQDLKTEARKAGWSVEDAVGKVLAKGWISFEARFVAGAAKQADRSGVQPKPWEGAR